jgi:MFS family permease
LLLDRDADHRCRYEEWFMSQAATTPLPTPHPAGSRQDVKLISLVGGAHLISHYSQLLLAPLFPWLKTAFGVSYAELGFLMTVFFVVSCAVQAFSGFVVDRYGPRPILFSGLGLLALAAFGFAASQSYPCWRCFRWWRAWATACFTPSITHCSTAKSRPSAWAMPTACMALPAAWAGRWRRPCWCH